MMYNVTVKVRGEDLPPLLKLLGPDAALEIKASGEPAPDTAPKRRVRVVTPLNAKCQFSKVGTESLTEREQAMLNQSRKSLSAPFTYKALRNVLKRAGADSKMSSTLRDKGYVIVLDK